MADRTGGDRERRGTPLPADLKRLMELVVTRHVWGRNLNAEQMQRSLRPLSTLAAVIWSPSTRARVGS
jgi:hypothetical protein